MLCSQMSAISPQRRREGWREVSSADRAAARGGVGTAFHPTPPSDLQADTVQGGHASPDSGGVGAPLLMPGVCTVPPASPPTPVGSLTPARGRVETIQLWARGMLLSSPFT